MSIVKRLISVLPQMQRDLAAAEQATQVAEAALAVAEDDERNAARELQDAQAELARLRAARVALETEADGILQVITALREGS